MSKKLTKKQKVTLHRLSSSYGVMSNLALAMLEEEESIWYFSTDSDLVWANACEGLSIHKRKNGTLFVREGEKRKPEWLYDITDPILIDFINALAPKPKTPKKFRVFIGTKKSKKK